MADEAPVLRAVVSLGGRISRRLRSLGGTNNAEGTVSPTTEELAARAARLAAFATDTIAKFGLVAPTNLILRAAFAPGIHALLRWSAPEIGEIIQPAVHIAP